MPLAPQRPSGLGAWLGRCVACGARHPGRAATHVLNERARHVMVQLERAGFKMWQHAAGGGGARDARCHAPYEEGGASHACTHRISLVWTSAVADGRGPDTEFRSSCEGEATGGHWYGKGERPPRPRKGSLRARRPRDGAFGVAQ